MSRSHGWKPKPKFTAGLNVSQNEWDRIFGTKLSGTSQEGATPSTDAGGSNPQRNKVADGVTVNGEPAAQSCLTNSREESNANS